MKTALSSSTNLNKYKSQGKQGIVLQHETEETSYSKIAWFQTASTAKKYKTNFMKQAKEILAIPKPEIDCTYHQRKYLIANRGLFRKIINILLDVSE